MMPDNDYTMIIIATSIGFFSLAAILLVPIYLFLKREEKASEEWTKEALDKSLGNQKANTEV